MRFILAIFLILASTLYSYENTLGVCAIFQNEARFLKEWIDYHRLVGVEKFWLFNNNSEDDYLTVLQPYIDQGVVHLIPWRSQHYENDYYHHTFEIQTRAYNHCLNITRGLVKWVAFIDLDEFIVPVEGDNVASLLENDYGNASGLCINWVLFGTSFVEEIMEGEWMIEKLTKRAPLDYHRNRIYKSIVQPLHVKKCNNPHFFAYSQNHRHINTNGEKVVADDSSSNPCIDKLRINHYWSRDEKHFREQKIPRYMRWGGSPQSIQGLIAEKNDLNLEEDREILRFLERLKKDGT